MPVLQEPFPQTPATDCLAERCCGLGVPLLILDVDGHCHSQQAHSKSALLNRLFHIPIFESAIKTIIQEINPFDVAELQTVWPGCWILPVPAVHRRQCMGYMTLVFLADSFVDTEQFHHLCDLEEQDAQATAMQLLQQGMMTTNEVIRTATMFQWMTEDVQRQGRHDSEIDLLSNQLGEAYEELSLLYEISTKMSVSGEPEQFLDGTCSELRQVVGLNWLAMHLVDTDDRLHQMRGLMIVAGDINCEKNQLGAIGRELLARYEKEPQIIDDSESLNIPSLAKLGKRLLIVPLVRNGKPLGVLFGADKLDGSDLSSVDSKLVNSLAQSICIFLENAMLYEDTQDMFMGTLHSLVSAIDAKDTYTCGHSERVALLSQQLAEASGLDAETCQRVYLAGLVHDVGKIGVPDWVLTKPGRLTDEEYDMIKTHPRIGGRILQDIRQMQDLLPGVLFHHERYDGRGYPDGLTGDAIPLFGRLIALADSFDAMSSNRTYRSALSREKVLDEIHQCAGAQFDPKLAEVFTMLDFTAFDEMIQGHCQRKSPLHKELGE